MMLFDHVWSLPKDQLAMSVSCKFPLNDTGEAGCSQVQSLTAQNKLWEINS